MDGLQDAARSPTSTERRPSTGSGWELQSLGAGATGKASVSLPRQQAAQQPSAGDDGSRAAEPVAKKPAPPEALPGVAAAGSEAPRPRCSSEASVDGDSTSSSIYSALHANHAARSSSPDSEAMVPWWRFALKLGITVLIFILVSVLLEKAAGSAIDDAAARIMDAIGVSGLFLVVFLADGLPQPFTYVPMIFVAVKGNTPKGVVFLTCSAASYTAAVLGYGVGYKLRGSQRGREFFQTFEERYPYVQALMQRRGAWGVAIAALLPVPLAITTWTAGSFGVYFPHFLLAGAFRMPKIAVFVALSRGSDLSHHHHHHDHHQAMLDLLARTVTPD
eukprot:TRINITY_DN28700_c0_g1_i2.p2 TRINITY_DN28700_c0_g1~~TRINITY_DN28700_c0_g1_i2.p2  ORF type:complete len:333 (+),score=60.23 TRINITY_DN28700_c0_g1_i2:106-1104(+)